MEPRVTDKMFQIPLTLDQNGSIYNNTRNKKTSAIFAIIVWVFSSLLVPAISQSTFGKYYPLIAFIVLIYYLRFFVVNERYFKSVEKELYDRDYTFGYDLFWDIPTTSSGYPTVFTYSNGVKAIFVRFEHGSVVGKPENNEYVHFDVISEILKQLLALNIDFVHIDYMDETGKDSRMDALYTSCENVDSADLKSLLLAVYDYNGLLMNSVFSVYDVYGFFYKGDDAIFWSILKPILSMFLSANYADYTILDKKEASKLTGSIYNVKNFSANLAQSMYGTGVGADLLKLIWAEKGGERSVFAKTRAELNDLRQVANNERKLKRKKQKTNGNKNTDEDNNINLV